MELMEILKSYFRQRKLSDREKNLLVLLGFTIILCIFIEFIIPIQNNKIQTLLSEKRVYEDSISNMKLMIKDEEEIKKKIESIKVEKAILTNRIFLNLSQSDIIEVLDEILIDDVEIKDIVFSEPSKEKIDELTVNKIRLSIPYKGSYEGILEIINNISIYPKKILVDNLIMDRDESGLLSGMITLSLYSLNDYTQTFKEENNLELNIAEKSNPFQSFGDYIDVDYTLDEEAYQESNSQDYKLDINNEINDEIYDDKFYRILLEDFEKGNFDFIPSSKFIKGNTVVSNNSKSGNNSLRVEYSILAIEEENKAYIDLSENKILIKYPPESMGLWVNSYSFSPVEIGIRLKGQNNEQFDMIISKGISWIGWNYIEFQLPEDMELYPVQIDKIYLQLSYNREDYGVLIFDKLEANYPKASNRLNKHYIFHIVEDGETLDSISSRYYNTTDKKNLIIKQNELKTEDVKPGKILIIPK